MDEKEIIEKFRDLYTELRGNGLITKMSSFLRNIDHHHEEKIGVPKDTGREYFNLLVSICETIEGMEGELEVPGWKIEQAAKYLDEIVNKWGKNPKIKRAYLNLVD